LLELIINRLQGAGYEYIGMDHFALPTDDLVMARNNGTLQRNFQGYSTHANADMFGMGLLPSVILPIATPRTSVLNTPILKPLMRADSPS